ncbi:MAG: ABC transporter substrate-binding protein [Acetobacteraceae bacterium]|nr:ABC transporter substrate-binding protein [Acetobacteraceae bacterium]
MPIVQSRRHLLTNIAVAGATGFAGLSVASLYGGRKSVAAEPPPEKTTVRLTRIPSICIAPQYIVGDLLRAEGFTDIRYVPLPASYYHDHVARGEVDFSLHFAAPTIIAIDAGKPITVIGGVHVGCFELFATEGIRGIVDLKGRTVAVQGSGSSPHVYVASPDYARSPQNG